MLFIKIYSLCQVIFITVIGIRIATSALITLPRIKHMKEGGNGTIAACFQSTSNGDSSSLTPIVRKDIRWLWINSTTAVQLPDTSISSNVWSNGYILRATNVGPNNSGSYCCVIRDTETCVKNAVTQLIISVTPQLIIDNPMVTAIQGGSVQLTCNHTNPDSAPIRVRWYRNNTLLYTGEKHTISVIQQTHSYTLQVHNVTENDEGTYSCIADSVHSSKSVRNIQLTVVPMLMMPTSNTTTTTTKSPNDKTLHVANSISILAEFPIGTNCESIQQTEVNADLHKYIISMCNCTDIAIISTFFECRGSLQASYNIVIVGGDALLAAATFNHSLNNEEHLTTGMGIQFSTHNPIMINNSLTTTSTPTATSKNDDDTTIMHLNILIILTVILLILGLITGFATGWGCNSCRWTKDKTRSKANSLHQHYSENIDVLSPNIQPQLRSSIHSTTV